MKIDSLETWKTCLSQLGKHPSNSYSLKKESQSFVVLKKSELKDGSSLTLAKIIAISEMFARKKQDQELAFLVAKHIFRAAIEKEHVFFPWRFVSNLLERIKNFVALKGFVTEIEKGRYFINKQLELDSIPQNLKTAIDVEFRSKAPNLSKYLPFIQTTSQPLRNIFENLNPPYSKDTSLALWLITEKTDFPPFLSALQTKEADFVNHHEFVGVDRLKLKQQDHLKKLKVLAAKGSWDCLQKHTHHEDSAFDWWMFPTTWESKSFKKAYQLNESAIKILKQDLEFMKNYREGVELVVKSWGWAIHHHLFYKDPHLKWVGYNIRLEKIIHSLLLFEEKELLMSLKLFINLKNIQLGKWVQPYLK